MTEMRSKISCISDGWKQLGHWKEYANVHTVLHTLYVSWNLVSCCKTV